MRGQARGFTLVELLVALALTSLVGAIVLHLLTAIQRATAAQAERMLLQATLRTGAQVVAAELRELASGPSGTDLIHLSADSVTYRAARGLGFTCAVGPSQVKILDSPQRPFSATRGIAPSRDSLLLFVEGDSATAADDTWVRLPIAGVAPATCGTQPAIAVATPNLTAVLPGGVLASVVVGGPVRTEEVMRLKQYASGGQQWVGAASVSGNDAVQPLLGPIAPGGFRLTYLTGTGIFTSNPSEVRQVLVSLIAMSSRAVAQAGSSGSNVMLMDTLETRIALRNAPR